MRDEGVVPPLARMDYGERALRFDAALADAKSGSDADGVLAGMLADPGHDEVERPLIASALGDVRGPAGSAALRPALAGALVQASEASPRSRRDFVDLAGACVWALGKRDGAAATDALLEAVRHSHRDVSVSTTGTPSGGALVRAAAGVADDLADKIRRHTEG